MATVDELEKLAKDLIGHPNDRERRAAWELAFPSSDLAALIAVTGRVLILDNYAERTSAIREHLRAEIDRRLTDRQIAASEKLERAATFVGWVGVALAIVAIVVGLPGAVESWKALGWWWPWDDPLHPAIARSGASWALGRRDPPGAGIVPALWTG